MNEQVVSERLTSIGCRIGDVFRKYHKYAGEQTVRNEHSRAAAAFLNGVPCPEPLGIGYSPKRGMYYSEYRFHELERIHPISLTSNDLQCFRQMVTQMSNTRCDNSNSGWSDYLRGIEQIVSYVPEAVRAEFSTKLILLKTYQCEEFIHGDFSLENIARDKESGRVMVFDFQESCFGIKGWDWGYFLSCIPVRVSSKAVIDPYMLNLVKIITAIKLGRGIRKGLDIANRRSIFHYWWG